MHPNLIKQNKSRPVAKTPEQKVEQQEKLAEAKEQRIAAQLADVKGGVGWSSDQVLARYFSVSRQRIWVWSKEGKLPNPIKHGEATTRWKNSEVCVAEQKNFLGGHCE